MTTDGIIQRAALELGKHYLDPNYSDPDNGDGCICGGWASGDPGVVPGWDDHLAEVLAHAGLLAGAGAPAEPTGDTELRARIVAALVTAYKPHHDDTIDPASYGCTEQGIAADGRMSSGVLTFGEVADTLVAALAGGPSQPTTTDTEEA